MNVLTGYVTIPFESLNGENIRWDRQKYIDYCNKNNRVFVTNIDGFASWVLLTNQMVNRNDGIINGVDFPTDIEDFGSVLVVLFVPGFGYIAIGSGDLNNGFTLDEENQIKIMRKSDVIGNNSSTLLDLRGNKGILNINVESDQENGGNINIGAKNTNGEGKVKIQSDNIETITVNETKSILKKLDLIIKDLGKQSKFTQLTYELGNGFTFTDEFDNTISQNKNSFSLVHNKSVKIGDGSEKAVLGTELKSQLNDFFTNLNTDLTSLTVTCSTPSNPSSTPINSGIISMNIEMAKTKLNKLLSSYLKIQ